MRRNHATSLPTIPRTFPHRTFQDQRPPSSLIPPSLPASTPPIGSHQNRTKRSGYLPTRPACWPRAPRPPRECRSQPRHLPQPHTRIGSSAPGSPPCSSSRSAATAESCQRCSDSPHLSTTGRLIDITIGIVTDHLGQRPHLFVGGDESRLNEELVLAFGMGRWLDSKGLEQDCATSARLGGFHTNHDVDL